MGWGLWGYTVVGWGLWGYKVVVWVLWGYTVVGWGLWGYTVVGWGFSWRIFFCMVLIKRLQRSLSFKINFSTSPCSLAETCSWITTWYNLIKYKVVYDYIIHIYIISLVYMTNPHALRELKYNMQREIANTSNTTALSCVEKYFWKV